MTTARDEIPEANQMALAVGIRLDRTVRRLVARRDIVGPEWTFAKGRHLLGRREASGWAVWPRRDPTAYIVCVPDDLVREIVPASVRAERKAMSAWCAPGQSIAEMLARAAERD
jgi:hypothetical protein